jgi:hypothetical protein
MLEPYAGRALGRPPRSSQTLLPSSLPAGPRARVETGQSAIEIRPRELVLALWDLVAKRLDVECVATERVRRHLAVEDLGGDVGVIRSYLTPPLHSLVGANANESDVRVAEALDAGDPHPLPKTMTLRSVVPSLAVAIASLICSSE